MQLKKPTIVLVQLSYLEDLFLIMYRQWNIDGFSTHTFFISVLDIRVNNGLKKLFFKIRNNKRCSEITYFYHGLTNITYRSARSIVHYISPGIQFNLKPAL